jgi:hypothetical protein
MMLFARQAGGPSICAGWAFFRLAEETHLTLGLISRSMPWHFRVGGKRNEKRHFDALRDKSPVNLSICLLRSTVLHSKTKPDGVPISERQVRGDRDLLLRP